MNEYDDLYGDVTVNQANKKRLEKDIASGQKSLFFDYDARNNENKEEMKKAAAEKADKEAKLKEEAQKEKERREEDRKKSDLKQRPMISPKGNIFRGAVAGGGAGGVDIEGKMNKNIKPKMKAGGKVKSASARADGCCIRGKTRA